ncbi:MAG: bacterioferritin [Chloroflexi bacterium]|nr:bacterioferritin [Chloroflexota bacterium]
MKAKEGVLDLLNGMLTIELTAINQYFVQAEMCANWGYERLAKKLRNQSIDEMKDAERLIKHILYLEGVPNMQRLGTVRVGENVEEHFRIDLDTERDAVNYLAGAIAHCANAGDYTTRAIFEEMIQEEEAHVDWFETQLETIRQIGLERYLAQQIH